MYQPYTSFVLFNFPQEIQVLQDKVLPKCTLYSIYRYHDHRVFQWWSKELYSNVTECKYRLFSVRSSSSRNLLFLCQIYCIILARCFRVSSRSELYGYFGGIRDLQEFGLRNAGSVTRLDRCNYYEWLASKGFNSRVRKLCRHVCEIWQSLWSLLCLTAVHRLATLYGSKFWPTRRLVLKI